MTVTSIYLTKVPKKVEQGKRGFPGGPGPVTGGAYPSAGIVLSDGTAWLESLASTGTGTVARSVSPTFTGSVNITPSAATVLTYQRAGAKQWSFRTDAGASYWYNVTDAVYALSILNNGYIGTAGVTVPARNLHVLGTIPLRLERTLENYADFAFTGGAVTDDAIDLVLQAGNSETMGFAFKTWDGSNAIQALSINHHGYTGINQVNPTEWLHVVGNGLFTGYVRTNEVQSIVTYSTGFFGDGYKITETGGETTAEFDNLIVRKLLRVYELEVDKISAIGGTLIISPASGEISAIEDFTTYWKLSFDTKAGANPIMFAVGDYIAAQLFDGAGTSSYRGLVTEVNQYAAGGYILADDVSGAPWVGMRAVQLGSSSNAARQNFLRLTVHDDDGSAKNFISGYSGVTDGVFTGHEKFRLGNLNGITDPVYGAITSKAGLWASDVYLTGWIKATAGLIGGWEIISTYLVKDTGVDATSSGLAPLDYPFYAGATYANRATAPFRITPTGSLTATGIAQLGTNVDGVYGGNIAIFGAHMWGNSGASDAVELSINYEGYNAGATYTRNFVVYNGKGSPILSCIGGTRGVSIPGSGGVSIGVASGATSALLDLTSTSKALVVPRMTEAQANAMTKIAGMIVYMTDLGHFYGYTNAWRVLD